MLILNCVSIFSSSIGAKLKGKRPELTPQKQSDALFGALATMNRRIATLSSLVYNHSDEIVVDQALTFRVRAKLDHRATRAGRRYDAQKARFLYQIQVHNRERKPLPFVSGQLVFFIRLNVKT